MMDCGLRRAWCQDSATQGSKPHHDSPLFCEAALHPQRRNKTDRKVHLHKSIHTYWDHDQLKTNTVAGKTFMLISAYLRRLDIQRPQLGVFSKLLLRVRGPLPVKYDMCDVFANSVGDRSAQTFQLLGDSLLGINGAQWPADHEGNHIPKRSIHKVDRVLCLQRPGQSEEHSRPSKKGSILMQEVSIGRLQFLCWLGASTLRAGWSAPRML